MKEKLGKKIAKGAVTVLDTFLRVDANSAACFIAYQPKAPKELARFKRKK